MTKKRSEMTSIEIEAARAYNRDWRRRNPEKYRASNENWKIMNPEKNKAIVSKYQKKYYAKLKLDAITAYDGPICVICGETNIANLCIDHSFGDGRKHRLRLFGDAKTRRGWKFYLWLRNNQYPQDLGLRVLCISCNARERPSTKGQLRKMGPFREYDWLYKRYVTDNRTLNEIGEECNVSHVTISRQLVSFDIPRRIGPRKNYRK